MTAKCGVNIDNSNHLNLALSPLGSPQKPVIAVRLAVTTTPVLVITLL